jgi:hypothetical protein
VTLQVVGAVVIVAPLVNPSMRHRLVAIADAGIGTMAFDVLRFQH